VETKDTILQLRKQHGLSQEDMAEKLFVTRQAVSRWENGETTPSTETLKLISKLFDISINTLLDTPRQVICQACGMPLEEGTSCQQIGKHRSEKLCIQKLHDAAIRKPLC